ncbi:MAG TPA: hypothetical protein VGT41_06800 [Candidatus Babeliales bacterium]|nr:hypothetical protein [Candidatus Babeliales bacterium]
MKSQKNIYFFFFCVVAIAIYAGQIKAVLYAQEFLDKMRTNPSKTELQVRSDLERLLQIAKNKKQKDVERQLMAYIKKYFPLGPVRIVGENEIVLQKPHEGETYVLRPTSQAERAKGQGNWKQVRQEGLVLLEHAPTGSVVKPVLSIEDSDKGEYYWSERDGIWVFISNHPIQLSRAVSQSVAPTPTAPISESVVIAEAGAENVPLAPSIPSAPLVPTVPGALAIPGAPPVPLAPSIPGAPQVPMAPVAPSAPASGSRDLLSQIRGGKNKRGEQQQEKKELAALGEAEQQELSDEQKKQSDTLLVDKLVMLSRTCVKPTPGEIYPVTLENYKKSVKAECSELLKNELFLKRAELKEIRDKKFDAFLKDNALHNLDVVNDKFDAIVTAGVDMFSSALFNPAAMKEQPIRYLVLVFAGLYRNPQNERKYDASMKVSNDQVIAAVGKSRTMQQLIDQLSMLCINREFLHYKRPGDNPPFYLLDSWLNEEDSKPQEKEKPGEPWKIPVLQLLSKPEYYSKGAILGLVRRLISTMREQLLYAEVLDLEDEKRLNHPLFLVISNYQETVQPAKGPISQGAVDLDTLLHWNEIETFVDLENSLKKIVKQVTAKEKKAALEKLSELIKTSPDKDDEVKALYKELFKENLESLGALYIKHIREVAALRGLRQSRARCQKIRSEAEGLKKANKFAQAEELLATAYQGALLYHILQGIYWEDLPPFVKDGFTKLYRRSDDIYKLFDQLIKKSVGSLSALGFSKEDFALMVEPYGLLLMMIAEFNKTKEYQKLVNGLVALDTATKKADEESFDAVVNNKEYIHDITTYALYKNRLKNIRIAFDNFDIGEVRTAIEQLVKQADLYLSKNPVRGEGGIAVMQSAGIDITNTSAFSMLMNEMEKTLSEIFYLKIVSRIQALSQGGIVEKEHAFTLPEPSADTGWTRRSRDPYLLVALVKAQSLQSLQQVFVGKTIMDAGLIGAVDKALEDVRKAQSLQAVVRKTLDERWSGAKPANYQALLTAEVSAIVMYIQEYLTLQRDQLEVLQRAVGVESASVGIVPQENVEQVTEQEAEAKKHAEQARQEYFEEQAALAGF